MNRVITSVSLADQAYSLLKKEIISGKLAPGTALPEEKLASDLGVSRTPLREAIRKLAAEELVILQKGKPATVSAFSKEDSIQFLELRSVLEVYNIEQIIEKCDAAFFEELDGNLQKQKIAILSDDYQLFIEYDREFHLILASKNDNLRIREMIHQMNTGVKRTFHVLSNLVLMSAEGAYDEHVQIVEALKMKNQKVAASEMKRHLKNIEKRFLSYFEEDLENKQ